MKVMIRKLIGVEFVVRDGVLISERDVWEEGDGDHLSKD